MSQVEGMVVGSLARSTLELALVAVGAAVALCALYLVTLSVAALVRRRSAGLAGADGAVATRVVVLVPAYNEAELIGRCVSSLCNQTYPAELYDVVVIADNCTDATASIARSHGAEVLERDAPDARGKGKALQWAMDRVANRHPAPDAIVVVDADSIADPDFLAALVAPLARGFDAVQGESLLLEDGSASTALRAAAFLLVNRVRPAGRVALGFPVTLQGNGMLLRRTLLDAHPWNAFTSAEDLEYSLDLRLAGVRIGFGAGAILRSPAAPNARAADVQQLRWEGGKLHLARTRVPRLIAAAFRNREPSLLETALALAVPPLGFLAGAAVAGAVVVAALVAAGVLSPWVLAAWLLAVAAIPAHVLIGLWAARAPASTYRALASAPLFVCRKFLGIGRLVAFDANSWVRTERPSESTPAPTAPGRSDDGAPDANG
jgi:hypothetical protein